MCNVTERDRDRDRKNRETVIGIDKKKKKKDRGKDLYFRRRQLKNEFIRKIKKGQKGNLIKENLE